jgi:hypothetical protein
VAAQAPVRAIDVALSVAGSTSALRASGDTVVGVIGLGCVRAGDLKAGGDAAAVGLIAWDLLACSCFIQPSMEGYNHTLQCARLFGTQTGGCCRSSGGGSSGGGGVRGLSRGHGEESRESKEVELHLDG